MIIPPPLVIGSKIAIVSTASKIDAEFVLSASEVLKMDGFEVIVEPHTLSNFHQYAGTDSSRASDLQHAIDDPEIAAIICSRGGYGTLRTIQHIDWSKFKMNPKWIVGFSDVTVLHSALNGMGIASIHGVMLRYFTENKQLTNSYISLKKALEGEPLTYSTPAEKYNREGDSCGELVGGNLSILYSLRGTPYDIDTDGKILFIEDLSEYLYHLDRMMLNFKTGGKLAKLAGLIVGSFTGMKDNDTPFGKCVEEIILDAVSEYDYPVAFNFPAGHQNENFALKMGIKTTLSVNTESVIISQ